VRPRRALVQFFCRRGRPAEPGAAARHDLAVLSRVAEVRPGWTEVRYQLGKALAREGERLKDEGRIGECLCLLRRGCQVLDWLAGESADEDRRVSLAVALANLGIELRNLERFAEAEEAFDRAERLERGFCAAHPGSTEHSYGLASILNERGLGWSLTGEHRRAREALDESIALLEKLRARGERDGRIGRQLGAALHNLARVEAARQRPERARGLLRRALLEQRAAVRALPQDRGALRFLGNHHRVLIALLHQQGRPGEAADACEQYLADFADRLSHFGGAAGYQRFVARWRATQGEFLRLANRLDEAGQALLAGLDAHAQLEKEPADHSEHGRILQALAVVRELQGRHDTAARLLRRAIARQQGAVRAAPAEAEYRGRLRSHCTRLGRLLLAKEDVAGAALVARELSGQTFTDHHDAVLAARLLAWCVPLAGERAAALRQELRRYVAQAVARCPAEATARNNLAWTLVAAAEKEVWDPPRAVALARLAVRAEPDNGAPWHTLGVALYRNGELARAVGALQNAMRFRKGGNAYDWLVLALIYQRRGDGKQARQWYERSRRWLEAQKEIGEELRRFAAEARQALEAGPGR
jgi:tetratricopeptide (TPR) repeat protein